MGGHKPSKMSNFFNQNHISPDPAHDKVNQNTNNPTSTESKQSLDKYDANRSSVDGGIQGYKGSNKLNPKSKSINLGIRSNKENEGDSQEGAAQRPKLKKGISRLLTPKYQDLRNLAMSHLKHQGGASAKAEKEQVKKDKKEKERAKEKEKEKEKCKEKSKGKERLSLIEPFKALTKTGEFMDEKSPPQSQEDRISAPPIVDDLNDFKLSLDKAKESSHDYSKANLMPGKVKKNNLPTVGVSVISASASSTDLSKMNPELDLGAQLNGIIQYHTPPMSPTFQLDESFEELKLSPSSTLRSSSRMSNSVASNSNSILLTSSLAPSTIGTGSSVSVHSGRLELGSDEDKAGHKGWEKVYHFFTGWMAKSKRGSEQGNMHPFQVDRRGKRLNAARLDSIRKSILNTRSDFMPHTQAHLITYASLYTLRLISILFSDAQSQQRLQQGNQMVWGIRRKSYIEFVEIDAPWDQHNTKRALGQRLKPSDYVYRVIKECWKSILKIGRTTTKDDAFNKKVERKNGLWFLNQFSILYGFSVIKLGLSAPHMVQTLMMISTLPDLIAITQFNEDTLYAIEHYKKDGPKLNRRKSLGVAGYHRKSISNRTPPTSNPRYYRSPLNPMHSEGPALKNIAMASKGLSHLDAGSVTSYQLGLVEVGVVRGELDGSIKLERVVLVLMECLARPNPTPFPSSIFGLLLDKLPSPQTNHTHLLVQFDLACDYLLAYTFFIDSKKWFRASCDQSQLNLLTQQGFDAYLANISTNISTNNGSNCEEEKVEYGEMKPLPHARKTILDSQALLDPRLVANYIKWIIDQLDGLIPVEIAELCLRFDIPHSDDKKDVEYDGKESEEDSGEESYGEARMEVTGLTQEQFHLLKMLLSTNPPKFKALQKILKISQLILYPSSTTHPFSPNSSSTLDGVDLATVLCLVPVHKFSSFPIIKQWNAVWGHVLDTKLEALTDPYHNNNLALVPQRVKLGFIHVLEALKVQGIQFFA